jgi:hypothetical protein
LIFNKDHALFASFLFPMFLPALFLIVNREIDTLRPGCRLVSPGGLVVRFTDTHILLQKDSGFVFVQMFPANPPSSRGRFELDVRSMERLPDILSLFLAFSAPSASVLPFQYSAIAALPLHDLPVPVHEQFDYCMTPLTRLTADYADFYRFHMTALPNDHFVQDTQPARLISDTLLSFEAVSHFVSSPIHPTARSRLSFRVLSRNESEPPLILQICQLTRSGIFCQSAGILVFGRPGKDMPTVVRVAPAQRLINVRVLDSHDFNTFLQPACDMIFILARLSPTTIVDFDFCADSGSPPVGDSVIPMRGEPELLPCKMAWSFVINSVKELSLAIASKFAFRIGDPPLLLSWFIEDSDPISSDFSVPVHFRDLLRRSDPQALCDALFASLSRLRGELAAGPVGISNRSAMGFHEVGEFHNCFWVTDQVITRTAADLPASGPRFAIPADDPRHTIIEYIVNVRHTIAALLFISPTNLFLVQKLDEVSEFLAFAKQKNTNSAFLALFRPKFGISEDGSSIARWILDNFPDFLSDNCDFFDFNESLFFLHGIYEKCFPLTVFLKRFLFVTSFVVPISDTSIEIQHSDGDFTYVSVQASSPDNSFTLASADSASTTLTSRDSVIVRGRRFLLTGQSGAIVCWRGFDASTFLPRIHTCFSRWRLNFSHQLVLAACELTEQIYELLPLSTVVSFEFAVCCSDLLRSRRLKFLESHTLEFPCAPGGKDWTDARPRSDEEFAATCAARIDADRGMPFTVQFSVWREICRSGSALNSVFRDAGFDREVTPFLLRWKVAHATADGLEKRLRFFGVGQIAEATIRRFLREAPEISVLFFIEWASGEWGVDALAESKPPEIAVVSGAEGNVRVIQRQHLVEMGSFSSEGEAMKMLMIAIQEFLNREYG